MKNEDEEDVERLKMTFGELEILSQGLGMVHLYSGFADVAKWMGLLKKGRQVSYKQCADLNNATFSIQV